MRRHKDPKRKTSQAQKTPATPTAATTATSTGALHPLRGGAPVTWRCTRTEEVHCLRIGCSASTHKKIRGTGTPNHSPPHPSMRSWALLAAGWARRPRHHLHSGPLRHLSTPLNAKSRFSGRLRTLRRPLHRWGQAPCLEARPAPAATHGHRGQDYSEQPSHNKRSKKPRHLQSAQARPCVSLGARRAPGAWCARRRAASQRSDTPAPPTRRPSQPSGSSARSREK